MRSSRAREVVEPKPQHDGAADPTGGAHPTGDAVDQPDEHRVDVVGRTRRAAERVLRPDRAPAAAAPAPAEDRGCGRARGGAGPTPGRASRRASASPSRATSPTVVIPLPWSLSAVTGPTPHSRSTGSGWRKASSPSGGTTSRPSGLATPLATLARNFVRATPTVIGRPDPLEHVAPQPRRDLGRACPRPAAARRRRGTPRRSRAPRPAASCARTPRTPPCSPRSTPTCGAATTIACGHSRRACGLPSRCGRRTPAPRSWSRARLRRRRSPGGRAAADRRAARPTRRTRRGRRAGSSPRRSRTYVRNPGDDRSSPAGNLSTKSG